MMIRARRCLERVKRQLAQAGGFGLADAVFDAGVLAVA
jgi:hypothetical protein